MQYRLMILAATTYSKENYEKAETQLISAAG